jgi:hypothetical protein
MIHNTIDCLHCVPLNFLARALFNMLPAAISDSLAMTLHSAPHIEKALFFPLHCFAKSGLRYGFAKDGEPLWPVPRKRNVGLLVARR